MNELIINYNYSKSQKVLSLIIGGYIVIFGLYLCVMQALANTFAVDFYLALAAVVLGAVLVLNVTLWAAKPIFQMNSDMLYAHMPQQKTTYQSEWINIREVGIGVSYLKMLETDGKEYTVDLAGLKYTDLKDVKSQVIELCESKSIPYRND